MTDDGFQAPENGIRTETHPGGLFWDWIGLGLVLTITSILLGLHSTGII